MIRVNMILGTILKEKNGIEYMLQKYRSIIDACPKGSLYKSEKNGQSYYYLKYREGKKVITKYVGKDAGETEELIEKRKHAETMIKSLEEELKIANKALEGRI